MPEKWLLLVDFDRTLFDTGRFFVDVWQFAASLYDIDAEAERRRAGQFHTMYGDWYDYEFFDHVAAAAGEAFDREAFMAAARRALVGNYLYDDVTAEIISLIDVILTFGNEPYQSFKLSLCPELAGIEPRITLRRKGEYIRDTFTGPTVLIDDKMIGGEIRPPARFIRIERDVVLTKGGNGEMVITSFDQLPGKLREIGFVKGAA